MIAPARALEPAATQEPLVSVILPAYQAEGFVLGAVRSALHQTHRNLEIWIVDDGSTDGTGALLATIDDPRVRIIRQANAGTAAARNAALALARGAYVAFLDSDDRWLPGKIRSELAVLQRAPEPIAIAYSGHYAVDDRGRLLHAARVRRDAGPALDLLLDGDDFLMPSLCLFDRRIFDAIGGFKIAHYHEDYDLALRALRRFPIYPTGERLAVYRQSTSGKCRAILRDYERARDAELSIVDDLHAHLSPDELRRLRENVVRSLYLRFLMYGFSAHARRLRTEFPVAGLRGDAKGLLGKLFATTGLNLMDPARRAVQGFNRIARQRTWRSSLARWDLDLRYE